MSLTSISFFVCCICFCIVFFVRGYKERITRRREQNSLKKSVTERWKSRKICYLWMNLLLHINAFIYEMVTKWIDRLCIYVFAEIIRGVPSLLHLRIVANRIPNTGTCMYASELFWFCEKYAVCLLQMRTVDKFFMHSISRSVCANQHFMGSPLIGNSSWSIH